MASTLNADNINNGAGTGAPTFGNGANIVGGAVSGTFTGSPTFSGNPNFSGSPTFTNGVVQIATQNSSNTAVTLTSASNRLQNFTGFTGSTVVTLPSTGVSAGEVWFLSVTGAAAVMVLNASGGGTITQISAGWIRVMALSAAPTTAAGWLIIGISCVEYLSNSTTTNVANSTAFQYGTAGNTVIGSNPGGSGITKRVRAICPIQPTDACYIEFLTGSTGVVWMNMDHLDNNGAIQSYINQGTAGYGIGITGAFINSTDIDVIFGTYAAANNATYFNTGITWTTGIGSWRLKKFRAS